MTSKKRNPSKLLANRTPYTHPRWDGRKKRAEIIKFKSRSIEDDISTDSGLWDSALRLLGSTVGKSHPLRTNMVPNGSCTLHRTFVSSCWIGWICFLRFMVVVALFFIFCLFRLCPYNADLLLWETLNLNLKSSDRWNELTGFSGDSALFSASEPHSWLVHNACLNLDFLYLGTTTETTPKWRIFYSHLHYHCLRQVHFFLQVNGFPTIALTSPTSHATRELCCGLMCLVTFSFLNHLSSGITPSKHNLAPMVMIRYGLMINISKRYENRASNPTLIAYRVEHILDRWKLHYRSIMALEWRWTC